MANNYLYSGDVLDYTNGGSTEISSGAPVLVGSRLGIALVNIPAGGMGSVRMRGVFTVAKLSTDAVAQGDLLYWDATNARLTTTASTNKLAGYAAAAAGAGVTTVAISLNA